MTINISEQIVKDRSKTWGSGSKRTSITVHETANTSKGADAQAHANLQSKGNVRQASWHIQVDDKEAIRSFPDGVKCWHATSKAADSIAVEICVNSDGDYDKALENAADVVRQLREKHNLGRNDVVDHNHWTGKNCPTKLRASGRWDDFVASTDAHRVNVPSVEKTKTSTDSKPQTESYVQNFQKALGVTADGFWGPITDRRAKRLRAAARAKVGWPQNMAASFDIRDVQDVVGTPVDGIWGPKSQKALVSWVKKFQKLLNVKADGKWGPRTDGKLLLVRRRYLNKF